MSTKIYSNQKLKDFPPSDKPKPSSNISTPADLQSYLVEIPRHFDKQHLALILYCQNKSKYFYNPSLELINFCQRLKDPDSNLHILWLSDDQDIEGISFAQSSKSLLSAVKSWLNRIETSDR